MFIPGIFFGEGVIPPTTKKVIISPQTAAKLCAIIFFFDRNNELQTYRGNFLLKDNKHGKLFVIKQRRDDANLCLKCTEISLAAGPAGELMRSPDLLAAMGAYLQGDGGKWRRTTFKGTEGRREGGGITPPPK